ncbi:MAG: citramalate synthase [Thermoguttaceae bacterium]
MRRIQIYDTTLRDGSQAEGIDFSLNDKILLTQRLDSLGFDFVEGGYPASNEKDAAFFKKIKKSKLQCAKVAAFGMTRRKGVRPENDEGLLSLVESGAPVITIVGKSSAFQVEEVIKTSLKENTVMIAETIEFLRSKKRRVFFDAEHFFDGWKSNPVYSLSALRTAAEAGAETLILCDTNGGTMPEEIAAAVTDVINNLADLGTPIGIHVHNDCGLAVANSLAAVDAGVTQVQGTINGFGERCGNANLIEVIANLLIKKNGQYTMLNEDSLVKLTELSRYVYEMLNMHVPSRDPYVGKSAFAHKGGMHVSGVSRNTSAYEHIQPELVGNERRILISELSGRSNIAAKASKYNIQDDAKLMKKILAEVVAKESGGYQFEAAEGSFDLLVRKCSDTYKPHFERLNYHVNVEADEEGALITEGTVKLRVGEQIKHEVDEGDGPVDALNKAIRKALVPIFPTLAELKLVDFKVRVINSEAATGAKVRVVIESSDGKEIWGTVGVNENVIEASWEALIDSFEYKLYKDGV